MRPPALPPDVPMRRHRLYQWARRASLVMSWLVVLGVPLWHLRSSAAVSALSADGRWFRLASWLGLPGTTPRAFGAPWTLRIFGLELLDPLAGLGVIMARGAEATVLLGVLPTLLAIVVLGRFFCGWLCPYRTFLAASNHARTLLGRLGVPVLDVTVPRRLSFAVLAGVLFVAATAGSQLSAVLYPPAMISRAVVRAVVLGSLGWGATLVALAFLFDTLIARAGFCRYLCPGGALMSMLGTASPVRVVRDATNCTGCGACDRVCNLLQRPSQGEVGGGCERCGLCIASCAPDSLRFAIVRPPVRLPAAPTRAERRLALAAVPAVAALAYSGRAFAKPARLRPPRAARGRLFAARCIRCQRCAEACPPKAIRFDALLDVRGSDLPFVEARRRACTLCMRCTQACPTEALQPTEHDLPTLQTSVAMGRPVLATKKCLAWSREGVCRLCYYACPYPGSAIVLTGPDQAPVYHPEKCVGCGRCEEVCPERARAIRIEPKDEA